MAGRKFDIKELKKRSTEVLNNTFYKDGEEHGTNEVNDENAYIVNIDIFNINRQLTLQVTNGAFTANVIIVNGRAVFARDRTFWKVPSSCCCRQDTLFSYIGARGNGRTVREFMQSESHFSRSCNTLI